MSLSHSISWKFLLFIMMRIVPDQHCILWLDRCFIRAGFFLGSKRLFFKWESSIFTHVFVNLAILSSWKRSFELNDPEFCNFSSGLESSRRIYYFKCTLLYQLVLPRFLSTWKWMETLAVNLREKQFFN